MNNKGKLFYVVGASGAGKDTLIEYAQKHLSDDEAVFVRRYITRSIKKGGENHIEISIPEFQHKCHANEFAMWWKSHGNFYGISKNIDNWLKEGMSVVINGSRGYHSQAFSNYPKMYTVLIEVSSEILRERLNNRGRENQYEIAKRIERSEQFKHFEAPNLIRINNDMPIEISGNLFLNLIQNKPEAGHILTP